MELREAIEDLKQDSDHWLSYERGDRCHEDTFTVATILNAVADGTLIPADQCYEVREGYGVYAHREYPDSVDCLHVKSVPLSEALHMRSADDVRREALLQAIDLFETRPDAVKVIRAELEGGDEIIQLRERLEQAEQERNEWKLAAKRSHETYYSEGFRAGIEAAATKADRYTECCQSCAAVGNLIRALASSEDAAMGNPYQKDNK